MDCIIGLGRFDHGKPENRGPETLGSILKAPGSEIGSRLTIKIDYINHNRNRNRVLFLKIHNQL